MRYSEKEAFNQCPYKYKLLQEDLKRIQDDVSQHHLKWGQGIHAGLEAHYGNKPWNEVEAAFLAEYPKNLDAKDTAKTVDNGIEVLKRYVQFYAKQDQVWEVLATEHEGTIELEENSADLHGLHIDLIARHKQSNEIYFWDHKTSGKQPGLLYWKAYDLSGQVTRYAEYVQQKYGSCAGCYINGIFVKHLLRKNKYGEGPGLVVTFERQLFNRNPEQVKFWKESDLDWIWMIEQCKASDRWPKALNNMCGYCEFFDLCLASGNEQIKELLYKNETDEFNVEVQ